MDSPTSIRSKPQPETPCLSPSTSQRRDSTTNSPEFEFWSLTKNPSINLITADKLFHDGVLLLLDLLSIKPDPTVQEPDPDPSPSDPLEEKPSVGSELTKEPTVSKRWRDIFKKSESNNKNNNIKPVVKKEKVIKESKKKPGSGLGTGTGAELNINIWPFSRSRSAGNNMTRPRMSFGAPTRKVSSAPCSRSNSTGESKSRKWPSSPGRNGLHLGRNSPVWQVRRGKTVVEPMGRVLGKKEIPEVRRGKTVIVESNKAKVLNLNVPMCIGYRSRLSCRNEESENIGNANGIINANVNVNSNPNGLFGFRNLFVKKIH